MSIDTKHIISEGKTKKVYERPDTLVVDVVSKDDITAGDGAKHDELPGKAVWSTQTTCNVFRLLHECRVPVAFIERTGEKSFSAQKCCMIPYEVVVRRELHGSAIKREPYLSRGHLLNKLRVEFYLKTAGRKWGDFDILCDDPYALLVPARDLDLYDPNKPLHCQEPFMSLADYPLRHNVSLLAEMRRIATWVFLILEKAWQLQGCKLVDFKLEFGLNADSKLLLADVIDNDSWRLLNVKGAYLDKEVYRRGESLDTVAANYAAVATLSDRFALPNQQIILWAASEKDDLSPFHAALDAYDSRGAVQITVAGGSLHKGPIDSCQRIAALVQDVPDSVVIVYCGRSNGAGPTLSAQVTVPVITVPAGWERCPGDVWSSLRTPSNVPVMTVLEPKNAVLAALQILAARNPALYAQLRLAQEPRLINYHIV